MDDDPYVSSIEIDIRSGNSYVNTIIMFVWAHFAGF